MLAVLKAIPAISICAKDDKMLKRCLSSLCLIGVVLALQGCASTLNSWVNREIQENQIEVSRRGMFDASYDASVMGMTATRRGILIRVAGDRELGQLPPDTLKPNILFCAEPPPDAMQSLQASLSLALEKDKIGEARLADTFAAVATNISQRTPISETYRTAVFSICQLYINGALTRQETQMLFSEVTLKALSALEATAGKESVLTPEKPDLDRTPPTPGPPQPPAQPPNGEANTPKDR